MTHYQRMISLDTGLSSKTQGPEDMNFFRVLKEKLSETIRYLINISFKNEDQKMNRIRINRTAPQRRLKKSAKPKRKSYQMEIQILKKKWKAMAENGNCDFVLWGL